MIDFGHIKIKKTLTLILELKFIIEYKLVISNLG
jgi:hypothetical protein